MSTVTVVGGGLAGLAAALACADAGAQVTLVESRSRLGGAASSFRRGDLTVDTGQHVFLRCCTAYRAFLTRLGTADRTRLQPRLHLPVLCPDGRGQVRRGAIRRGRLPAPLHLAATLATYPFLTPRERFRAAAAARALAALDRSGDALDRRTFGDWLREHGQSDQAIDRLWDLVALPALNLPARDASLDLAAMVFQTGLLHAAPAGDLGLARVPLVDLHAAPAAAALRSAGAQLLLSTRAVAVDARPLGVVLADGTRLRADAVIVAVPHDVAAELLPDGALPDPGALRRLGKVPICNLHVLYDRRVTDLEFAAGVGTPVQWVFDRTEPSGYRGGQYLAVSLSAAEREAREPVAALRDRFVPALQALFPRARRARVVEVFATREPAATIRQAPGVGRLRPWPRTGVPGLFLAGAWTATGWPATMEGAVRSGLRAADAALAPPGQPKRREVAA